MDSRIKEYVLRLLKHPSQIPGIVYYSSYYLPFARKIINNQKTVNFTKKMILCKFDPNPPKPGRDKSFVLVPNEKNVNIKIQKLFFWKKNFVIFTIKGNCYELPHLYPRENIDVDNKNYTKWGVNHEITEKYKEQLDSIVIYYY